MAGFVQVIEWRSSRIDEIRALSESFRSRATGDGGGPQQVTVVADRDRPGTYLTIARFASYEAAMANSARPETGKFAARMAELCDGPPTFYNTDVIEDEVLT